MKFSLSDRPGRLVISNFSGPRRANVKAKNRERSKIRGRKDILPEEVCMIRVKFTIEIGLCYKFAKGKSARQSTFIPARKSVILIANETIDEMVILFRPPAGCHMTGAFDGRKVQSLISSDEAADLTIGVFVWSFALHKLRKACIASDKKVI